MADTGKLETVMSAGKTVVDAKTGNFAKRIAINNLEVGEQQKCIFRKYADTGHADELIGFDWS